jgi:uncharacterized protein YndB with AHSA1/START domain
VAHRTRGADPTPDRVGRRIRCRERLLAGIGLNGWMTTTHPNPIPIDGITIVREFDAPAEQVFDAWVTARQFAVWFGADNGEIPVETVQLDARPGGVWKATMFAGPERHEIHWTGEFVAVEHPDLLVIAFTDQEAPDGDPAAALGYLTVHLADLAGRTRMTFHQSGGDLPPEELQRAKAGWQSFFDVLDRLLREAPLD